MSTKKIMSIRCTIHPLGNYIMSEGCDITSSDCSEYLRSYGIFWIG